MDGGDVPIWSQCGGIWYTGSIDCVSGSKCTYLNEVSVSSHSRPHHSHSGTFPSCVVVFALPACSIFSVLRPWNKQSESPAGDARGTQVNPVWFGDWKLE
ncbi:hypothetical protein BDZ94DRAFT_698661 [Collybia nuda]|uniref:CBM1 domain-containing protein n=1 Tax=Collybia nuda TaxID=64659 RepID=A0A9P5Y7Q5_9AGAR|nr:hypothetical protein BDZ94DRAFT_698661 [Collybia nuda]